MGPQSLTAFKSFTWVLVIASFVVAFLSLLMPLPPQPIPGALEATMFLSAAIAVLHFGIPYLFYLGLAKFTVLLRRAYALICVGIVLLGAAYLQFPILSILGAWDSFWVRGGILPLPFFLAVIFLILGARRFARLLNISHVFTNLWVVFIGALLFAAGVGFIPPLMAEPTLTLALTFALMGWVSTISLMVALVVLRIKQTVGTRYTHAMRWFFWAFLSQFIAAFHYLVMLIVLPEDHWYEPVGLVPVLIAAFVMVRAGYVFNQIGIVENSTASNAQIHAYSSPVDVVIYLADLVSSPREIDQILDDLRIITARHKGNELPLSNEEQLTVASVYNQVRQHLLTTEKLRVYTEQELDEMIAGRFGGMAAENANTVFWNNIKGVKP